MTVQDFDRAMTIVDVVAKFTKVSVNEIGGRGRGKWPVVWARYCAIELIRRNTKMAPRTIAVLFGRHRTAIVHAKGALQEVLDTDPLKRVEFDLMRDQALAAF